MIVCRRSFFYGVKYISIEEALYFLKHIYIAGISDVDGGFRYDNQDKVFCKVVCESSFSASLFYKPLPRLPGATSPLTRPIFMPQTSL